MREKPPGVTFEVIGKKKVRRKNSTSFSFLFSLFNCLFSLASLLLEAEVPLTRDSDIDVPELFSRSAVLMDAATGTFLYYKNPDEIIPPASLTKLMTMHLALKMVEGNPALMEEPIAPPPESWAVNQPPHSSLMFLANGQQTNLRELLLGLAIPSGNDAAVAVALHLTSSVAAFTEMMNREAETLGLMNTHFDEPSGISEFNLTTARDFANFCRFYIEAHPEALRDYHTVREFAYPKPENVAEVFRNRPGTIVQYNHNRLLETLEGVDGLKTGYIDESGYNIALTAKRGETRFIAVILGAPLRGGEQIRNEDGRRLLTWAFENYKTVFPPVPILEKQRVWKGKNNYVNIGYGAPLEFTSRINRASPLHYRLELLDPLIAPLSKGSQAGELIYYDDAGELYRIPLLSSEELEAGGFFKRLIDSIRLFFRGLFQDL